MFQEQLYGIAIFEREILLTDYTDEGEQQYVVDEKELSKLFKYERRVLVKPFPGLVWVKASIEGRDEYLVTMKRKKRKLIHCQMGDYSHITMEIPNVAIRFSVHNKHVLIEDIYAFKGELKKSTPLYELALPNVTNSSVCNGESMKIGKTPMKAAEMAMFETPFNHHAQLVGKEKITFLQYVRKYKGRMPFSTLNQIGTGQKILEDK